MSKVPDLREVVPLPDEIAQASLSGELVFFVGAGVSMLLGLPSWRGLAEKVLEELRQAGYLNYSEIDQLRSQDPKKLLSIARLIADENEYELEIQKHISYKAKGDNIYNSINRIGCPCVTTNYDELLAPRYIHSADGSKKTRAPVNRVSEREKFFAKLLDEPGTVIHLHGCISKPKTMIVTTKDYLEHYDHANVQGFLGELFQKKTIVFLGYGLEESEILEHILRRGQAKHSKELRRYSVQGFYRSGQPLYENLHKYYDRSFGVRILGFIRDHDDYRGIEQTIKSWVGQIEVHKPPLVADVEFMREVLGDG